MIDTRIKKMSTSTYKNFAKLASQGNVLTFRNTRKAKFQIDYYKTQILYCNFHNIRCFSLRPLLLRALRIASIKICLHGLFASNNTQNCSKTSKHILLFSEGTLQFVNNEAQNSAILLVDIGQGEGILSEGRRSDGSIVLRMKENLFVQFKIKEAEAVLKNLINLYRDKIKTS